jgi:limonene-1,2-epoxide hydrolase
MATPSETVLKFLSAWSQPGGFAESIRDTFTPATIYENVGLSYTTGIDEALAMVEAFEHAYGFTAITVDTLAIAQSGNTVFTERVDHMIAPDGATITSIRLMGIFEVDGDRIIAWRDYFDASPFKAGG